MLVLELLDQPIHDALIPVVATEVGVTAGRLDLEYTFTDLEHGDVEGAAAEVEDEDQVVVALVHAVCE